MNEQMTENKEKTTEKRFCVGDQVIYRAEGICDVVDVREEAFGGSEKKEYYILSPRNDPNSVMYVPLNNETLTAMMRPLLRREEIFALAKEVREERIEWIKESRARSVRFRDILSIGDRREVIVLLHTVREHMAWEQANKKKTGSTDLGVYRRAVKLLTDEFSATIPVGGEEDLLAILDGKTE